MKKNGPGKHAQGGNGLRRFSSSLLAVVLVLTIPTLVAFGYFTASIANSGNHIQAGSYQLNVTVKQGDDSISPGENETYSLKSGTYSVALAPTEGSVSTGYCKVVVGGTEYYTGQIGTEGYSFSITNYETNPVSVTFTAQWGTYSGTGTLISGDGITVGTPRELQQEPENEGQNEPSTQPDATPVPTATPEPSTEPTTQPSPEPTTQPSPEPTVQPSAQPDAESSEVPTEPQPTVDTQEP